MEKEEVLKIIDSVMNNREIDSIRNAILAIRDQVLEFEEPDDYFSPPNYAVLKIRGKNLFFPEEGADGSKRDDNDYVVIDMNFKIDSGIYGALWYTNEPEHFWR